MDQTAVYEILDVFFRRHPDIQFHFMVGSIGDSIAIDAIEPLHQFRKADKKLEEMK